MTQQFEPFATQSGSLSERSSTRSRRRQRSSTSSLYYEKLESRQLLAANPIISEFMASNDGTLLDQDGASSDWIEIINTGDTPVDLGGWSLTDNAQELTKWSFPSTTLGSGQALLVFASGKDRAIAGAELHSNFKLSAGGEYLALVEPDGTTIASDFGLQYPLQYEDISYGVAMGETSIVLVDDTTPVRTLGPTDGSLGNTWTGLSFNDSSWQGGPGVTAGVGYEGAPTSGTSYSALINAPLTPLPTGLPTGYARFEFQLGSPSDISQLSLAMQYDDGFIAYLNGVEVASDNAPTVPAWNSTATGQTPDAEALVPVDFNLNSHVSDLVVGTNVLSFQLLNRTPGSSDLLLIPELTAVQSAILDPPELGYFAEATPGAPNGANAQGFTIAPEFSVPRGFYDSSFDVTISTATAGANLYYTTNGSEPTESNGTLYTGPVTVIGTTTLRAVAIKDDFFPSTSVTNTYLFASDIINQPALPAGFPSDWGTHNNHTAGNTPFLAQADYEIDSDVVGPNDLFGGIYTSRFEEALTSLPTISLTMDTADAFDGQTGFYANSLRSGREWERETSVEWWDPADNSQFQVNAGIRAHGGVSRQPWRTPKHGLRLYFRGEYGPGRLEFPLFGDDGVTSFDRLVFRSHYNDSWQAVSSALHTRGQFIQDPFVRQSFAEMGNLSIRSRPTNVYINGLYWGVYDITERPDADYFADHLGGDADDWDVINRQGSVQDGNADAWNELINLVRTTDLTTTAGYEAVKQKLDVQNLVDYMLVNFYAGVDDWPHNNWVAASNRATDGKFRFYVWDAEISMNQLNHDRTGVDDANSSAELYDRLRVNADFRQLFKDRALLHLQNGGVLTPEASIERYQALGDQVKSALVAESARWGDVHPNVPLTVDNQWQNEFDSVINSYLPQRTNVFINQLQAANLASNLTAPEFATAPGFVPAGTSVALINNQSGSTLYYTLDGTDPRNAGGAVSGSALSSSSPVTINAPTTVSMRVLSGGEWSGIVSGTFEIESSVVTRGIAYGGATAAYGPNAIDTNKVAYQFLPGTSTSRANFTSYTRGLNRVVVELANFTEATLSASDFEFRVGNTDDPSSWTVLDGSSTIPLPTIVNGVRDSVTGVQRFTLAWPDFVIKNQWLQVTVKAGSNTGLTKDDVFYFGNQVGDVAGTTAAGQPVSTDSFDLLDIKLNQGTSRDDINNSYDIDRSGRVNSFDLLDAKLNQGLASGLLMLSAPAAPQSVTTLPVIFTPQETEPTLAEPDADVPSVIPEAATADSDSQSSMASDAENATLPEPPTEIVFKTESKIGLLQEQGAQLVTASTSALPPTAETRSRLRIRHFAQIDTRPSAQTTSQFSAFVRREQFLRRYWFTATPEPSAETRFSVSPTSWVDRSLFSNDRSTQRDTLNKRRDRLFAESPFASLLRKSELVNFKNLKHV